MAETGITVKEGYLGIGINSDGDLIYEYDEEIDNVDLSLNSQGHLVVEME